MPTLTDTIVERLIASGHENASWALVILAALDSDQALATLLDGTSAAPVSFPQPSAAQAKAPAQEPPGVYVSSVTVAGFRGIGSSTTLPLKHGPGLTLVVGRNGSGKSSFAEALECLFTGTSFRWDGRSASWKSGWKNLHHTKGVALQAGLIVEGKGPLSMSRVWRGDTLTDADTVVSAKGKKDQPLATLGWQQSLTTFRPFLSYNELGSMLDEGPSKLYDALSSVLGLDELTTVQSRLALARKTRQQVVDAAKEGAKALAQQLATADSPDDRIGKALAALTAKTQDLGALGALIAGDTGENQTTVTRLRNIASLRPPDLQTVQDIVEKLRRAERAFQQLAETDAARAQRRADLMEAALKFHDAEHEPDCPVCGSKGTLSPLWRAGVQEEVAALRKQAETFRSADTARSRAITEAKGIVSQPPPVLAQAVSDGLATLPDARTLWSTWSAARDIPTAAALADHLDAHILAFSDVVTRLSDEAADEAQKRDDAWRPLASSIAEWLPTARKSQRAQTAVADLKQAETWWKDVSEQMRAERFAPIARKSMDIWKQLRLQSNVDVGNIDLEGTGVKRKVVLRVTVDGTPAEAVGVMSQGELHALALSLFLPRATLPESPFRFIIIDDPVQSMDPARVDGLARVLGEVAKTRQVVVFTHDDRLPEATRRLGLPATVMSVTRRQRSAVDVKETGDPVSAYIDDARAVAKTSELPADVAARVIPGFCRAAIEAVCMEKVRVRRLSKGALHEDVERLLTDNVKTHPLMALALFDDEKRTVDVLKTLNRVGAWAADVFIACKEGAHEKFTGDLDALIDDTRRLAAHVRSL